MSRGDAAEELQFGEEALDEITLAIEPLAEAGFPLPIGFGRDVRRGSLLLDELTNAVRSYLLMPSLNQISTAYESPSSNGAFSYAARLSKSETICPKSDGEPAEGTAKSASGSKPPLLPRLR